MASLDLTFDTCSCHSRADVERILDAVQLTTCLLNPCSSWLVKAGGQRAWCPLVGIINLSFETMDFPERLKEAVVRLLFKKVNSGSCKTSQLLPVSTLPLWARADGSQQLQDFLGDTSASDPFQSGFHFGHGMKTMLVSLTNDLHR